MSMGGHCHLDAELLEAEGRWCAPSSLPKPGISMPSWFSRAAVTKRHTLGSLKPQKMVISHFWSLQVQNQGAGEALLPLLAPVEEAVLCSLSQLLSFSVKPWACLACRYSPSVAASFVTWPPPLIWLCLCLFSSSKGSRHIGLRTHPLHYTPS